MSKRHVIVGSVLLVGCGQTPEGTARLPPAARPATRCEDEYVRLQGELSRAQRCERASDCVPAYFSCPFPCQLPVNPNAIDFAAFGDAVAAYKARCDACQYRCTDLSREPLHCVDKLCTR